MTGKLGSMTIFFLYFQFWKFSTFCFCIFIRHNEIIMCKNAWVLGFNKIKRFGCFGNINEMLVKNQNCCAKIGIAGQKLKFWQKNADFVKNRNSRKFWLEIKILVRIAKNQNLIKYRSFCSVILFAVKYHSY